MFKAPHSKKKFSVLFQSLNETKLLLIMEMQMLVKKSKRVKKF